MKTLGHLIQEAKATYCGRCGTTHVPPSKGGTCPALKEEVDYDRHFSRQSKEVQTKINHHLRQGADYPTAARKAGATALKVGKMNEGVVANASKKVLGPAGSARRQAANVTADAGSMATGMSSGEIAAPGAVQLAAQKAGMRRTANVAKFVGQGDTLNAAGRAVARGLSRVAPRATSGALGTVAKGMLGKAGPLAMAGLAAYDAYKGYNSNPKASTSQKLKNAGINALSGLTFGLSKYATGEMKESTTHGNDKMKTLTQFMAEANSTLYVEEELSPEMQAIFDAINEAVGDRELSEEEFVEIYNYVVENLQEEYEDIQEVESYVQMPGKEWTENRPGSTSINVSGTGTRNARYTVNGQQVNQQQGRSAIAQTMNRVRATNPGIANQTYGNAPAAAPRVSAPAPVARPAPRVSAPAPAVRPAPRVSAPAPAVRPAPRVSSGTTQSYSGGSMISQFEEATTGQDYLKSLPKKPGGGLKTLPYPIKPGQKPSGGIKKLPYPIKPGEKPAAKLAPLEEAHDIELKPHPNGKGTHFVVHKINDKSIGKDQLKAGETVNDSHVDDLKDMGYSVKIHD